METETILSGNIKTREAGMAARVGEARAEATIIATIREVEERTTATTLKPNLGRLRKWVKIYSLVFFFCDIYSS